MGACGSISDHKNPSKVMPIPKKTTSLEDLLAKKIRKKYEKYNSMEGGKKSVLLRKLSYNVEH